MAYFVLRNRCPEKGRLAIVHIVYSLTFSHYNRVSFISSLSPACFSHSYYSFLLIFCSFPFFSTFYYFIILCLSLSLSLLILSLFYYIHSLSLSSLTVASVNQYLDQLAHSNVTKDRKGVKKALQMLLRNTSAGEQKWLIRIIMKVSLPVCLLLVFPI